MKIDTRMRQGEFDAMPRLVPDALLEEAAIVAPAAGVPGALRRRYEGLLDRVSLYFPVPEGAPEAGWRTFVDSFRAAA